MLFKTNVWNQKCIELMKNNNMVLLVGKLKNCTLNTTLQFNIIWYVKIFFFM